MKTCNCNNDKACTIHAETLYGWERDKMSESWNEAKDIAINEEIARLAKVDAREIYNDDKLSEGEMKFLDMLEIQNLFDV